MQYLCTEKDIGLKYVSANLKTRPIKEEDRDFWYDLHASESVCKFLEMVKQGVLSRLKHNLTEVSQGLKMVIQDIYM